MVRLPWQFVVAKKKHLVVSNRIYCCCIAYLSPVTGQRQTLTVGRFIYYLLRWLLRGWRNLHLLVNLSNLMFLWISLSSCPLNLLYVWSSQVEVLLIQGCNNLTRARVEPRSCDQRCRKNNAFTLSVTQTMIAFQRCKFVSNNTCLTQARSQDLEKEGGYFERVRSVQATLTWIFIDLESVSYGLSENWDEMSRKARKFKGFFLPKLGDLQKKKKRSSPKFRVIFRPKSEIQRFFPPKIRWSPKKKKKKGLHQNWDWFFVQFRKFRRLRGGCFRMGGLFSIFHRNSASKSQKTCDFAYFTSQWGLEPPPPPLATLLVLHLGQHYKIQQNTAADLRPFYISSKLWFKAVFSIIVVSNYN